jgi:hypothetical protein
VCSTDFFSSSCLYSDQAAPTDTRGAGAEAGAPSTSASEQLHQVPSNDKAEDAAPRGPPEPAPGGDPGPEDTSPARKRLKSPTNSVDAGDRTRSPSPSRRSIPKHTTARESMGDFPARRTTGRLWNEGDPIPTRLSLPAQPAPQQHPRQSRRRDHRVSHRSAEEEALFATRMIVQPDCVPISQEQLVAEVKGIYAGLVMCVTSSSVLRLSLCLRCPADPLLTTTGSSPDASRRTAG